MLTPPPLVKHKNIAYVSPDSAVCIGILTILYRLNQAFCSILSINNGNNTVNRKCSDQYRIKKGNNTVNRKYTDQYRINKGNNTVIRKSTDQYRINKGNTTVNRKSTDQYRINKGNNTVNSVQSNTESTRVTIL